MTTANLDELRLQSDFSYFSKRSWPDPIMNNTLIVTPQHKSLVELLMKIRDTVCIAYRWFGKSVFISGKYAMWRATQHGKSVCIFSASEDLAIDKLRWLKIAFETDVNLNRYCGKGIYTRKDDEIWLTDKTKTRTGANGETIYPLVTRIKAMGFDSRARGLHFDIVIGDDIVVEENTVTVDWAPDPMKIAKVKADFNAKVVPIRNPGWAIVLVGTPQVWIQDDVPNSDLLFDWVNRKGKESFLLPALDEHGDPSCPELHTKEFFQEQKDTIDAKTWEKEYMLRPMVSNQNMLSDDLIYQCLKDNETYYDDYIPKMHEVVILGVDFAIIDNKFEAEKKNSAYFTMAVWVYNLLTNTRQQKNVFFDRGLWFSEQIGKVNTWCIQYHVTAVGVEMHWGMRLFAGELQKLLPSDVIIVDATNQGNKFDTLTGIPSLTYLFEKKLIELPNQTGEDKTKNQFLIHELKYMKMAQHFDLLDACLRCDTVIRMYYYVGSYNPNFSVRNIPKQKTELSDDDIEALSVFGPPDEQKKKELLAQRAKEVAHQNILNEQARINVNKRKTSY